MTGQFLRAQRASTQPEGGAIRFVASTEGVKRDGMDLKKEDWALDNFRNNSVFLWMHNPDRPPHWACGGLFRGP